MDLTARDQVSRDDHCVLAGGSRIYLTTQGPLKLTTGRRGGASPGYGPSLMLPNHSIEVSGNETVDDLAVAGDRVVALFEPLQGRGRMLAITTLALEPLAHAAVPYAAERVAVTDSTIIYATNLKVHVLGGTPIHGEAVDLAATTDAIAILDASGATFFDSLGAVRGHVPLFAPTAIAVDRIEPGWLVAIDGGVFHLDGPGATPRLLASVDEPVAKVRRSPDAIYVRVGRELRAITGDRVERIGEQSANAWHWEDFDAGSEGWLTY